jgi:hypothetical protein
MTEGEITPRPVSAPSLGDHLTIFGVSLSLLVFQIALTRVLSVVVWYHFAFLTISLVMLGIAVPGVWFARVKNPVRLLPACLLASGALVPLSVVVIVKAGSLLLDSSVVWIILAVLPAMIAMGAVICLLLIKAEGPSIGRMYGADLLGACLGAFAVIPLLHVVPTPALAAGCALPPLIALAAHTRPWRLSALVGLGLLAVVLFGTDLLQITYSKTYDETIVTPLHEEWSPIARITIFDESFLALAPHQDGFAWGRGEKYTEGETLRQYWLEQDGHAGSPITQFDGDLEPVAHLLYDVTTAGHQIRPPETVAVIGAGGGRDILSALLTGATDIDAVELNSHTIALMSEDFAHVSGDIYHRPGVTAVANEGRSHLTHSTKRYDLIQIALIDSWAASAAGAFALAENSLYTVEAFQLYMRRLTGSGMVSTSRWLSEMPRLLILARAALEAEGIARPERHMLLIAAGHVGTLLLSKAELSASDIAQAGRVGDERGFRVLYPSEEQATAYGAQIIEGRVQFLADAGFNIEPPTDDSPYFFHVVSPFADPSGLKAALPGLTGLEVNFSSTVVLRHTMVAVSLLALLLFVLPFISRTARGQAGPIGNLARGSLFFAAIGTGFMLMENTLVQRSVLYLGHPSYAVSIVIAALLLGMGLGSGLATKLGVQGLKRLGWLAPVSLALLVLVLPSLFAATLGSPRVLRVLICCVVLVPLGALLGVFFPLGMLRFGDADKPWFWAINGVFGVVASVMSLSLSMAWGFTAVGELSVVAYVLAWLCLFGNYGGRQYQTSSR